MKTPEKIAEEFNKHMLRTDDLKIKDWSFSFNEGHGISAGLDNNKIGGPYSAPSVNESYGGSAYIIWSDGQISHGNINPRALEDLGTALKSWRNVSYTDPDAPEIPEPQPMPDNLKINDDSIVKLITEDSTYLFDILEFYNKELAKKDYTQTISANANAGFEHTNIMNSKGLSVEWDETGMTTSAHVNNIYGDSYSRRNMVKRKNLNQIIKEVDKYLIHTTNQVKVRSGNMPIILAPDMLGAFLGKFLLGSNLAGSKVANNQSLYSIDDFKIQKQIFDEKINIIQDGLKDYRLNTAPCDNSGIPAKKQYIIANGRLMTPFMGIKYAQKLGIPPTSVGSVGLEIEPTTPYGRIIKELNYGLIVYSVLGMNTQRSKEGQYSLTVGQGLLVEDGEIKGKIEPAVMSGNFLDALKDKKTRFAKYRKGELAMKIKASIIAKN